MCAPLEADGGEAETSADLRATGLAGGEPSTSCCSLNNAAVKKLKIKQGESSQEVLRQHTHSRLLSQTHFHTRKINPGKPQSPPEQLI